MKKIKTTFTATKDRLNTHFGVISKLCHQRSVCVPVHLSSSRKKHGLKCICYLFETKHTDFFSCIFDVQYTIVSHTGVSVFFYIKSD